MPEPWGRLPEETSEAFEAFVAYRDMGAKRSVEKLMKLYGSADPSFGKSRRNFEAYSTKYAWVERVAAWEAFLDSERRRAILTKVEEMSHRHAAIAQAMQGKVIERMQTIKPEDLTIQTISDMAYQLDGGGWQALSPLDGAFDGQIENFAFSVGPLADGPHTITVSGTSLFNRNGGVPDTVSGTASDPITIGTISLPGPGVYDDKQADWIYTGTWPSYPSASAYSGGYHYSTKIGDSASFSFIGSKFTLTYGTYATYGNLDVYVDNVKVATLNQFSAAMKWQLKYTSPVYTQGVHTVRFVHASGSRVNVDALQIYGPPDIDPPAAITNLAALPGPANGSVNLTWTAPAEDASLGTGTAASYQVRYALTPLNAGNWVTATAVTSGLPIPAAPGVSQQMTVTGLVPGVPYYFAVRAQDEEPNLGGMSNSPTQPATSPAPLGAGKYDDKNANWILKGTWTSSPWAAAYSGSYRYSTVINNSATFVFTGTNFVLGYAVGLLYGGLDVYVDGVYVTTINQKASPTALRTYTLPTALTAGQHTVQFIHHTGTRVNIDSIVIVP